MAIHFLNVEHWILHTQNESNIVSADIWVENKTTTRLS